MSDEIKNFREAVERFDEIQADLEVLKEQLDNSFANYKGISENSAETVEKLNNILRSVNTLQINLQSTIEGVERRSSEILKAAEAKADAATKSANDLKTQMGKYWSQEYNQTKKDFDNLYDNINSSINTLKQNLQTMINAAIRDAYIDTTQIEAIIEKEIQKVDLSPILNTAYTIERYTKRLDEDKAQLEHTVEQFRRALSALEGKAEQINNATRKINKINKSISTGVAASLLVFGTVFGFGIATYFKIDAISEYYFSRYDKKQAELEKQVAKNKENYKKLKGLQKFIADHNIDITYGTYKGTDTPFVSIANPKISNDTTIFKRIEDGVLRLYVGVETDDTQIYEDTEHFKLNYGY